MIYHMAKCRSVAEPPVERIARRPLDASHDLRARSRQDDTETFESYPSTCPESSCLRGDAATSSHGPHSRQFWPPEGAGRGVQGVVGRRSSSPWTWAPRTINRRNDGGRRPTTADGRDGLRADTAHDATLISILTKFWPSAACAHHLCPTELRGREMELLPTLVMTRFVALVGCGPISALTKVYVR